MHTSPTAWYFSNIGVLLLNKYLLSVWGFKYPVFLTMCHMLACLVMSIVVRATGIAPKQNIKSRRHLFKVAVLAVVVGQRQFVREQKLPPADPRNHLSLSLSLSLKNTKPLFHAFTSFFPVLQCLY